MAQVLHSAPKFASNEGVLDTLTKALGSAVVAAREEYGEIVITVARDQIESVLRGSLLVRFLDGLRQVSRQ